MGRPEDAAALLKEGNTPGQIASAWGVTLNTVLGYLDQMIGRGAIRRSDIYFSLPPEVRKRPVSREEIAVVQRYGTSASALGDMYEAIGAIETTLHGRVRTALETTYGTEQAGWWRRAVPLAVRQKCVMRREEDPDFSEDAFLYTDLIDLKTIIRADWTLFQNQVGSYRSDRPGLLRDLDRLNVIRRNVMHPVRREVPGEDDFAFLRDLRRKLDIPG